MHYKLQKWFIQLFLHISVLKWINVHCYTWYSHEVESYLTKKNKVCMHTMIPAHTCSAVTSLLFQTQVYYFKHFWQSLTSVLNLNKPTDTNIQCLNSWFMHDVSTHLHDRGLMHKFIYENVRYVLDRRKYTLWCGFIHCCFWGKKYF